MGRTKELFMDLREQEREMEVNKLEKDFEYMEYLKMINNGRYPFKDQ